MSNFEKTAAAADLWIELGLTKTAGKLENATEAAAKLLRNRPLMGGIGAAGTGVLAYRKYKKGPDGKSRLDKEVQLAEDIEKLQQEATGKKPGTSARLRALHQQLAAKNPALIGAAESVGGGAIFAGLSHLLQKKG